jgi:hypothetical protein
MKVLSEVIDNMFYALVDKDITEYKDLKEKMKECFYDLVLLESYEQDNDNQEISK